MVNGFESNIQNDKIFLCKSVTGEGVCVLPEGKCRYAHTVKELRPRLCHQGDNCRKKHNVCKFVHADENIKDYVMRLINQDFVTRPDRLDGELPYDKLSRMEQQERRSIIEADLVMGMSHLHVNDFVKLRKRKREIADVDDCQTEKRYNDGKSS